MRLLSVRKFWDSNGMFYSSSRWIIVETKLCCFTDRLQKANGSEIFCVCNTSPYPIAEDYNPHPFTPHLPTPVPVRKWQTKVHSLQLRLIPPIAVDGSDTRNFFSPVDTSQDAAQLFRKNTPFLPIGKPTITSWTFKLCLIGWASEALSERYPLTWA